jgi:hypothetical protein
MGFVRNLTGANQAKAAQQAGDLQQATALQARDDVLAAKDTAQGFFEPFQGVAQRGVDASNFLANPEEQFNFLQSNPLFQLGLDNANQQTQQVAASRGRLNAGDTLQDLTNNALLAAQPLLAGQRQDINSLLQLGSNTAANQANIETGQTAQGADLLTGSAAAKAAGVVGRANAKTAGAQGTVNLAADIAKLIAGA